jgi:chromate reductase, NAD(P)H dehydrogenase (quinone)
MHILALCGSLQAKSSNLSLLEAAARSAPPESEVVIFDGLRQLPHFDPDLEAAGAPTSVTTWREALRHSDGLLIASPEYGHSLPGVLKNAIDWAISSGELEFKVVAITCAVKAPERGLMGLQALRQTLNAVSAQIVGGAPIVKGPHFDQDAAALLAELLGVLRGPRRSFVVSDR